MGRHSAPDDDTGVGTDDPTGVILLDDDSAVGRHANASEAGETGSAGETGDADEAGSTAQAVSVAEAPTQDLPAPIDALVEAPTQLMPVLPDDGFVVDPAPSGAVDAEPPVWHAVVPGPAGPEERQLGAPPVAEPATAARPEAAAAAAKARASRADFALVRAHGDVLARCLAGLVVPFVVYLVVMLAIGATGRQVLLWIFIPLIAAGVLVGTFLDAGYKRYRTSPPH